MSSSKNSKRRINLLIVVAGLHIGGAEVVIQNIVNNIDKTLFNVTIVCIKALGSIGEKLKNTGYDIISFDTLSKKKVDYLTFIKLLKIIRKKKIDIIHSHTNDALADAAVCKILYSRFRLIHTFHYGNYLNQKWSKMWIEHIFSRFANRLIAVGEVQKEQIKKVLKLKEKRVGKVWNGISISEIKFETSFRKKWKLSNQILIGTICTLTEQKGLFDLLLVAKKLKSENENIRFVIAGDGPLRTKLEKLQIEYGLRNDVIFTGWMNDAAKSVLPNIDIFFQPSLWEAMSIVILEAMAAAKPIVATNVGENPNIIEHDVNGLLVEPKDIKGMVDALKRLIKNAEMRNSLGKKAKEKVINNFTVENMTREYEKMYIEEYNKIWFKRKIDDNIINTYKNK